jgi:TonB-linked SusC/RagA family outer membrane protein
LPGGGGAARADAPQEAKIAVSGVVSDADGPIIGASVVERGTSNGTATDVDGRYTLRVSPNATLQISYLGYLPQSVAVGGKSTVDVTLKESATDLDELVVVGFQSQKKVNLTGAITSVTAETFENRPVSSIGQALQGLVPNLNIGIANGGLNETPSFNIRGGTSMSKNSSGDWVVENGSPLILVDGVEINETFLNQLNPNDIEAMSVIKDASAAAIYGTKATYGVILITTKSGKFNQKGKVSYSFDFSWDTPAALPDIMNAAEIQQAAMNYSLWRLGTVSADDEKKLEAVKRYMADPTNPDNRYFMNGSTIVWTGNMNPYKEVVRDWTPTQKHNVSISGGSEKMTYYISLGYQGEEGMYKIKTDSRERYNGTVRLNATVNKWFNVEGRATYNKVDYDAPYIPEYKGNIWDIMKNDADKNINMPIKTLPTDPIPNTYTDNFLSWVEFGARTTNTRQTAVLSISPEFIIIPKMLKIKADLSYTPETYRANRKVPARQYVTFNWGATVSEVDETKENRARLEQRQTDSYLMNIYAEFNKTFAGVHNLSAILGYSQERVESIQMVSNLNKLFSPDIQSPGAVDDVTLNTIEVDPTLNYIGTGRSVFGRINYNYAERYLLELNGRDDGSSKFTSDGRYFFFPSVSAGWRISEEKFMDFSKEWLTNLKIRGSWGKLGSQPSGYYPYQPVMSSGVAYYFIDGKYVTKVGAPQLVPPTLTWAKAETTNFGVDAGFLANRLNTSFELYTRKTTDILVEGNTAYPNTLGGQAPLENSGSIQAKGWEWSVQWSDKAAHGIRYNAGFTLADARTKVLSFPSNPTKIIGTLYDGAYIGDIWGYETGGILQAEDLIFNPTTNRYDFADPTMPKQRDALYPGDIWFKDLDDNNEITLGSSTADNPGDRRIIGNNTPRFRYTITGGVSWNGWDANVFFQGVAQRDVWISSSTYWGSTQNGAGSKWMNERSWQPDRTDAKYPRYLGVYNKTINSGYLVNGAYLRLKQAVVGYTLPQKLTSKWSIDKVRFSLAGYNLFEITDVPTVFDPDQISDAYPSKRTVALSAQITF